MNRSIPLILAASLAILFAASTGHGQDDHNIANLSPDESIKLLPLARFAVRPTQCREVGKDCAEGEFLAILKNPNNPNLTEESAPSRVFAVLDFLQKIKDANGNSISPVTFTGVSAYQLDAPVGGPYSVCGQFLLRIKFTEPKFVNEAMLFVWSALKLYGSPDSLIEKSTLLGIQPLGATKPQPAAPQEPRPTGPVPDAITMIGSKNLPAAGQILPSVTVAVLDTGWTNGPGTEGAKVNVSSSLARDVSDIDGPRPTGLAAVADNFYDPKIDPGMGHGTPIASIIGSSNKLIGVAPNALIVPIKICKSSGDCDEASAIYGACYAMSPSVRASVINMSFAGRTMVPDKTGFHAPIFEGLIRDAAFAGTLVVVAAGNSRDQSFIDAHPNQNAANEALFPGILSSGYIPKLVNQSSALGAGMLSVGAGYTSLYYAAFATYHDRVDITAPGSWVRALGKDGQIKSSEDPDLVNVNNPVNVNGTSFSAAYVSGAAAFLIGQRAALLKPRMMPVDLAKLIVKTANPTKSGCLQVQTDPKYFEQCGNGFLDVYVASINNP
jgi:Subtilase family